MKFGKPEGGPPGLEFSSERRPATFAAKTTRSRVLPLRYQIFARKSIRGDEQRTRTGMKAPKHHAFNSGGKRSSRLALAGMALTILSAAAAALAQIPKPTDAPRPMTPEQSAVAF